MAKCNKITYKTKRKAREVRDRQQAREGTKLHIYKHKRCRGYHLTKQPWGKHKIIT